MSVEADRHGVGARSYIPMIRRAGAWDPAGGSGVADQRATAARISARAMHAEADVRTAPEAEVRLHRPAGMNRSGSSHRADRGWRQQAWVHDRARRHGDAPSPVLRATKRLNMGSVGVHRTDSTTGLSVSGSFGPPRAAPVAAGAVMVMPICFRSSRIRREQREGERMISASAALLTRPRR
jgi:hypothetical protein